MDSEHEIRDYLDRLVATGCAVDGLEKQWHDRYPSDSRPFRRRATKAWLAEAKRYRDIRHWGKFRRALILGAVVWGHPFTVALEQAALLLPGQEQHQEFSTCLRDLARQIAGARVAGLSHFADRVRTYRVFDEFSASVAERGQEAKRLLVERPFRFGRTLIAFTNLHFLREQFLFDVGEEFQHIFGEHGSPEHLAEAASTLIALANEQQPLESIDFTFPLSGIEVSDDFISLLRYGAALQSVRETGKMISILSYEFVRERATRPRVYRLQPAHPEIEYALRLGFIRGEIGRTVSGLNVSRHESEPPISMLAGAEDLLKRLPQVAELKDPDTPYRRVRLQAPLIPQLYDTLSRIRFYEDALHEDRLGQELELPMRIVDAGSWEIVPGLDLETFHKTWRTLKFLALLDVVAIRRHQSDPVIVYNSLMRVHTEDRFVELLHVAGVDPDRVPVFLDLIAADVKRLGFYDMQYRPFLRVGSSTLRVGNDVKTAPPEIFHASGVIVTSNVTVNVQRAHGLRIKTNADAFVAIAEATLKGVFEKVRTNVPLKLGTDRTDVDIMILTEQTLYLIECKHSLTPTGAHEFRDLWRDINHGVHQLRLAMEILGERLQGYLAGVFPGTTKAQCASLRMQPVVLCSHRVFSGLSLGGIPVRDFASLALICGDGVVGMGVEDDSSHVVLQRYRLRANECATSEDFDEYLSDRSRFFEMFRPFMHEYDRLDRLFDGSMVLACNTFVHHGSQDSWSAHLERIGAVAVSSERHPVSQLRPTPISDSAAKSI